jgi:hypothetical protein
MLECTVMQIVLTLMLVLFVPRVQEQPKAPKNDPNGIWQTESGTMFEMKLADSDLTARLVEGSNPAYVKYEVHLKNTGEINSYEGTGFFVAKVQGKECRFETTWKIIVVQSETIAGYLSRIVPDPDTCGVKQRSEDFAQLKKVH